MNILEVIIIGVALATDAFAVTVANCLEYDNLSRKKEWAMPVTFAAFQVLMPVIGYYLGYLFYDYISSFSKFLTAGIFFLLAFKIVLDAIKERKELSAPSQKKPFGAVTLISQGVATSIDALAVGVTFSVGLSVSLFIAVAVIGAVTFAIVSAALFIGKNLGKLIGKYSIWLGALILFALAVKAFIEGLL